MWQLLIGKHADSLPFRPKLSLFTFRKVFFQEKEQIPRNINITSNRNSFQKSIEFDMPSEKSTTRYKQIISHYQITNEGKQRDKSEFVTKFVGLIITVTPK